MILLIISISFVPQAVITV